jgi:hypothetical protein
METAVGKSGNKSQEVLHKGVEGFASSILSNLQRAEHLASPGGRVWDGCERGGKRKQSGCGSSQPTLGALL